jgi:RNA 3'-terminal phosphate cyclase (ATP)
MLELDGSVGEGGGQIVRSALTLSLMTGQPFKLFHIRAGRSRPGLQPQHVTSVKAAAEVGRARYKGAEVGSTTLYFEPQSVQAGSYHWNIGTAGAVSLVLQTVYLPLVLRTNEPSEVVITGGTHVPNAPCVHFLQLTWSAYLQRMGLRVTVELQRPGFYPRGGGQIRVMLEPASAVLPLQLLDCPVLDTATVWSACAGLPRTVAERQAQRLNQRLHAEGVQTVTQIEQWQALSPGTMAAVVFRQTPVPTMFFALGERGKPAEAVADDVAEEALAFIRAHAPVDPHSADQLLLPLSFGKQPSAFRTSCITRHLVTNAHVVRSFLPVAINLDGPEGSSGIVQVGDVL